MMNKNAIFSDIAVQYGTPVYVYDLDVIQHKLQQLRGAFSSLRPQIAYACKANNNITILSFLAQNGCGADIVSGGELLKAIKAGFPADKIVFSGVGKTADEIALALDYGIKQINVESSVELTVIENIAKAKNKIAPVAFRLNPNVDAKTHAKITTGKSENKFGLTATRIEDLYEIAHQSPYLDTRGISVHIGSQILDIAPFTEAFGAVKDFIISLRARGYVVPVVDLGGGLGIDYLQNNHHAPISAYAEMIESLFSDMNVEIVLEPGRFLSAECGTLLTKIIYIKQDTDHRPFVILDAGMNDLIRPALYDAYHPIVKVDDAGTDMLMSYDIVGPVCETGDMFAKDRALPPLVTGDLIAIGCAGAYGFVMANSYNIRPMPAEVILSQGVAKLSRHRQNIEDLINGDLVV